MKYQPGVFLLTIFVSFFLASTVFAGDLTVPNTFSSKTTARASEANANFTAVETAVDDNDARLDNIGTTCLAGQYVRGHANNGAQTCATPPDTDALSFLSCSNDQVAKRLDSQWLCGNAVSLISQVSTSSPVVAGTHGCVSVTCPA